MEGIRSLTASLLKLREPCYSSFPSSRSSKRAITDQIFPGIAFFLVFRKHLRYVACLRAWTVAKEGQPRQRVWKLKKNVLIFAFWKTSKRIWLTLCLICLFYSLFIQCGGRMGKDSHINMTEMLVGKLEFKNLVKENNMDIAQARRRLYSVTH